MSAELATLHPPSPLTINDVIDAYMKEKRNPYAERVCLHPDSIELQFKSVRDTWGAWPVAEFATGSRQRVKDQVETWRREGLAANTCRKRISQLRTAFNFALGEELIDKVPIFKLPPAGPPRERYVDPKRELPGILKEADSLKTPFHIKLQTELLIRLGCRRGALLKLKWEHVDFEERVIRLRETQDASTRQINKKRRENQPMDDELYEILKDAKERADTEWVIEWRCKPVKSTYGGQRALYRRAGVEGLTTHDLRRSSATFVHNELGGDLDAAARHIADTKEMAAKTYVQADPKVKLPGLHAIGRVIAAARNGS